GGELHAARLAASAGVHLGLHHHRVSDLVSCRQGLLHRVDRTALGDGDAERGEQLLALIFEKIHVGKLAKWQTTDPNGHRRAERGSPGDQAATEYPKASAC